MNQCTYSATFGESVADCNCDVCQRLRGNISIEELEKQLAYKRMRLREKSIQELASEGE